MDDLWFYIPVLFERSASCDVAIALRQVATMKPEEQVDLDYSETGADNGAPWVRDRTGILIGKITASAWQRFGLWHDGEQPKMGEFARALEFGWLMRVKVQRSNRVPNRLSIVLKPDSRIIR